MATVEASPVSMVESPPVFLLAVLPPESELRRRLFSIVASLVWKVLLFVISETAALFSESEPLPEFSALNRFLSSVQKKALNRHSINRSRVLRAWDLRKQRRSHTCELRNRVGRSDLEWHPV